MDWIVTVVSSTLVCIVIKWIWDRKSDYRTWERLGISGPKPSSLFFGNILEIFKQGRVPVYEEWTKKYGKMLGYYEGHEPVLLVADLDATKEILIKQFENFSKRELMFESMDTEDVSMFSTYGHRWKRLRSITSPTFSTKNMKLMSPLVQKSTDKLMASLKKYSERDQSFDISKEMYSTTLDSIASVVFSYDADPFGEGETMFKKKLNELWENMSPDTMKLHRKLAIIACMVFPRLIKFFHLFGSRFLGYPDEWFLKLARKMIEERQNSGEQRNDYIQLMLRSQRSSDANMDGCDHDISEHKTLTIREMQAQAFIFIGAGYETTATTMSVAMHYLSIYPDIQAKLHHEIDQHFSTENIPVNYETVQNLPYLDMIFCETSRISGVARLGITRTCLKTTKVGDVTIPKGSRIRINVGDIHMNPEYWGPEPVQQFVPERFTVERKGNRHAMAYLAFGAGPKNCVGLRFGIMEAKMIIVSILKKYTLLTCEKSQNPLNLTKDGAICPADGVFVRLEERN